MDSSLEDIQNAALCLLLFSRSMEVDSLYMALWSAKKHQTRPSFYDAMVISS